MTAQKLGIEIPESFIVTTKHSEEEAVLFATKRYDRKYVENGKIISGMPAPRRLHQEDFAQALGIPSKNKYERNKQGYLKSLFRVLHMYSANPIEDVLKLWDICVFNYLVGNTDNHIKNISLLYGEDLKSIRLAPAYDIISTMIYKSSTENMALSINGIYNIKEITRSAFREEAEKNGLGIKLAMNHFDKMAENFSKAIEKSQIELEKQGFQNIDQICKMIKQKGGISYL